ncbi:hypothetical protein BHE90_013047 [Fusarium euwallaceae]|uniref:Uncharacterized protein n=1 Tax=Fusarium euwallaceae TaxID=1147111 RepID=A0A430L9X1_9HYPO|nr:hypothetical protein BHE90_013047 [Fusarium euwallaceae]
MSTSTNSGLPTVSVQNGQSAHPLNTPSTRMLGAWRGAKISALRRGRGLPRHSHSRGTEVPGTRMRLCWLNSGTLEVPRLEDVQSYAECPHKRLYSSRLGFVNLALKTSFLSPSHNGLFFFT